MALPIQRLFVHGFPGLYGGAGTELHHQILAWRHMNLAVHLIPTNAGWRGEPLYQEMLDLGVTVHEANDWSAVEPGDPVFGFCNAEFLAALPQIRERTRRTVFLNCMTWLFEKEREAMSRGLIGMFLYQNEEVRQRQMPQLRSLNADSAVRFMTLSPPANSPGAPRVPETKTDLLLEQILSLASCRLGSEAKPHHARFSRPEADLSVGKFIN